MHSENQCRVVGYLPEHRDQVLRLLHDCLWGNTLAANSEYFRYKYEHHPYPVTPIGLVVLSEKEVVGFRAFYPIKWYPASKPQDILLTICPTDTVIHPDYRRLGLFSALIASSFECFKNSPYQAFVNLSANRLAAAGLLKKGWRLLTPITFGRHYSLKSLARYYLTQKVPYGRKSRPIDYGRFGEIEVSNHPKTKEMNSLQEQGLSLSPSLKPLQDAIYLDYRYRNPIHKYHFFYFWEEETLSGFLSIRVIGNNRNAHIIDYAAPSMEVLGKLLHHIIEKEYFDILSIWDMGLDKKVHDMLEGSGFKFNSFVTKGKNRAKSMQFILIRPTREHFSEKGWFIGDSDMRNLDSWQLKELCADDA